MLRKKKKKKRKRKKKVQAAWVIGMIGKRSREEGERREEEVVFARGTINLAAQHFAPENLSQ